MRVELWSEGGVMELWNAIEGVRVELRNVGGGNEGGASR